MKRRSLLRIFLVVALCALSALPAHAGSLFAKHGSRASSRATTVFPLDSFSRPAAVLAAYGTEALTSAAIGVSARGVTLRRNSDSAEVTYSFGADGKLDTATINSWHGNSYAYPARPAYWKELKDQTGNSRTATQTTTGNQCSYIQSNDGRVLVDMRGTIGSNGGWFDLADGWLTGRNVSVFFVSVADDRSASGLAETAGRWPAFAGIRGAGYDGFYERSNPTLKASYLTIINSHATEWFQRASNCHLEVSAFTSGASGIRRALNAQVVTTLSAVSNNNALTSVKIGKPSGVSFYSNSTRIVACVITDALSDAEQDEMSGLLRQKFGLAAWTDQVVVDGDSITAGHDEESFLDVRYRAWPEEFWRARNDASLRMINVARSGRRIADLVTDFSNKVAPSVNATVFGTNNHLVVFAGTNDVGTGRTGLQAYNDLVTYCSAAYTAGFNTITVCTAIKRENLTAGQETERLDFNSRVMADANTNWDATVDLAALAWDYATHYQGTTPNRVHPNAAGRTLISNAFIAASLPF